MYFLKSTLVSLLSCSLAMLIAVQNGDSTKLPDTPAARRVEAFLKAFNTGSDAAMRDFHKNNAADGVLEGDSAEEMSQMDRQMMNDFGGFELRRVIQFNEHAITVLLQAKKGQWLRFHCEVEPNPPHKITQLNLEPTDAPANEAAKTSANRKMTEAEMTASLEIYLNDLAKEDKFSGVVLLAKDGRPIFKKAYGLADKARNTPNNTETKFNLGSMNKMFTAVAIAQLAEKGKLSFDDTVGKHLPDYPNKEVANKVTIHHLLTHTSGMGSYWNDKFEAKKATIKTVSDYLSLFVDEPLSFEPGKKWQYSNSGFIVLGAIVEKVSGRSYYDYVREHIYKPAGMSNTDAYEMSAETPNLARGYTNMKGDGPRRDNTSTRPNRGGPAGGGYSTAEDLLKFHIALRDNKLLSPKYTEILTTGKVQQGYGYGFGTRAVNGKRSFGHNGGAPGIASSLTMFPDLGYTVVVMTNYDPPLMMPVVRKIEEMITH